MALLLRCLVGVDEASFVELDEVRCITAPNRELLVPAAFGVTLSSLDENNRVARELLVAVSLLRRFVWREPKAELLVMLLEANAAAAFDSVLFSCDVCCSRSFLRRSRILLFRSCAVTNGDIADSSFSLPPSSLFIIVKAAKMQMERAFLSMSRVTDVERHFCLAEQFHSTSYHRPLL